MPHDRLVAAAKLLEWRNDANRFVKECLGATPDSWQEEALRVWCDPKIPRIAVRAAKGPGKSCLAAWTILHFLFTMGDGKSKPRGAAMSITGDNLRDNLWAEVGRWKRVNPIIDSTFTWSAERLYGKESPEDWFVAARSWPKSGDASQQANTLAGLHAPWVAIWMDESGGFPDAVASAADGILATEHTWAKILQTGNPTHLTGPLYRACHGDRHMWYVIVITGDPDDPKRSPRISKDWAREQIASYGRDNPWVQVNVFGKFPPSAMNSVLGADEVMEAMHRNPPQESWSWSQRRMGIDVARFGDDRTVIFRRQGIMSWAPSVLRGMMTTEISGRVMLESRSWSPEMISVDDTGHWGHGVIDQLQTAGFPAFGVQFHGRALNSRYGNRRAEMWLEMAEWVRRGGCLPNDKELASELTIPTYSFSEGRFMLESKDQIKSRCGRSPDLADALCLSFSVPDMPGANQVGDVTVRSVPGKGYVMEGKGVNNSDFDPFREV